MFGILSYGYYIPRFRIKTEDIASVWGKNSTDIIHSLAVKEKSVAGIDEDSLTMAYESSSMALKSSKVKKKNIKTVFFGSESPPYAVNPASTTLAHFLGIEEQYLASDMQFACKAATGGIIIASGLIASGFTKNALVVASDKATGRPHDALEYTAASGSVALLLGKTNLAVRIIDMTSYSSDTPDFWRREGIRYPSHSGRFTGKPSYFHHIFQASTLILMKNKMKPTDFAYAVFHMPNGTFPLKVGSMLGFTERQISPSLVVNTLGNSYTASGLMGLVSVLEIAKTNDYIYFASYGSGAGSDAFILQVTSKLQKIKHEFKSAMENKEYINYAHYLRCMEII